MSADSKDQERCLMRHSGLGEVKDLGMLVITMTLCLEYFCGCMPSSLL